MSYAASPAMSVYEMPGTTQAFLIEPHEFVYTSLRTIQQSVFIC